MNFSIPREVRAIVLVGLKSVATLGNAIIFLVLALLFYFGERQVALFLSLATVGGVVLGVVNDVRARMALERLQFLTTPLYLRVRKNGTEERIKAASLQVSDRLHLSLGDQVPCDGVVLESSSMEVSEALRTGESRSFIKKEGDTVSAGDVIVAGYGLVRIDTNFENSTLGKMTENIKRFEIHRSPIETALHTVITYSGYGLLVILAIEILHEFLLQQSTIVIIEHTAALTSMLMPQGLLVAVTLLFAYGSLRMYKDHVLIQDIAAAEKIGHIQNLCIDKTGTLTENIPSVEKQHVYIEGEESKAATLTALYLEGSHDSSQTAKAIERYIHIASGILATSSLPFTSQRQYGAVVYKESGVSKTILMAGPDVLLEHMHEDGKRWVKHSMEGALPQQRLVCVATCDSQVAPESLQGVLLTPLVIFELKSVLRPGTTGIVKFFQSRGVRIRVISGDNPQTVSSVAEEAGIAQAHSAILGSEIETWTEKDFTEKLNTYTVFARVRPELKEKLIERFQASGFTAMIGDGANDALAIKKADLGIAMFDGAQATRQLASVVLMNNSFSALPAGIELADSIIGNAEVISSIYFFQIGIGLVLFFMSLLCGVPYPLNPQTVVLLNYCAVGLPGIVTLFQTVRGIGKVRMHSESFLRRILPLATLGALLAGCIAAIAYMTALLPHTGFLASTLLLLACVLQTVVFLYFATATFTTERKRTSIKIALVYGILCSAVLAIALSLPILRLYFAIAATAPVVVAEAVLCTLLFACALYILQMGKRHIFY